MRHAVILVASSLCATVLQAQTASLKMRFVYDGAPPAAQQINVAPRFRPAGGAIPDERLLVDPVSKGIGNVVVYVYTGRGGSQLDLAPYEGKNRRLLADNIRFEPHILLAQAGDTLEVMNRGQNGHNLYLPFFNNPEIEFDLAPGKKNVIPLTKSEPAAIPVFGNIYPWMKAYLVILEHPFAGISDKDGAISVDGLPANTKLVFKVYHEAGLINQVKIKDVPMAWNRSRFELDLSPGDNDLGDVLVPGNALN